MESERTVFTTRMLAALIDAVLLTILCLGIVGTLSVYLSKQGQFHPSDFQELFLKYKEGTYGFAAMTQGLILIHIAFGMVSILYHCSEILIAATPGKYIMGIKIRDEEGGPAPLSQLVLRTLAKQSGVLLFFIGSIMASLPILIAVGIANAAIFFGWFRAAGFERQALHDTFALTALYSNEAIEKFEEREALRLAEEVKQTRKGPTERDPSKPDPNTQLLKKW